MTFGNQWPRLSEILPAECKNPTDNGGSCELGLAKKKAWLGSFRGVRSHFSFRKSLSLLLFADASGPPIFRSFLDICFCLEIGTSDPLA